MVDARGVSGNGGGSSSVGVAGSNGHRSHRGSRGNSNRSSDRAASRDDKEVGSGSVAVGDGLVLSSKSLRGKRTAVADSIAVPESSGVPARLWLAVPVFRAAGS